MDTLRVNFFTSLHNLNIDGNLEKGIYLIGDILITNSPEIIDTYLTPSIQSLIGINETNSIKEKKCFIYSDRLYKRSAFKEK